MESGTHFYSIISSLERIADHLTNIAFSIKSPTGSQREAMEKIAEEQKRRSHERKSKAQDEAAARGETAKTEKCEKKKRNKKLKNVEKFETGRDGDRNDRAADETAEQADEDAKIDAIVEGGKK